MEQDEQNESLQSFLMRLGSDAPAPGGGAAAGVSGALGAALGRMVAELTRGRAKYAAFEADAVAASDALLPLIEQFCQLADADAAAYDGYMAALAMPKGTDKEQAERKAALQRAIHVATDVPCAVMEASQKTVSLLESLYGRSNRTCVGDLAAAAACLRTSAKTAWLNVLANLPYFADWEEAQQLFEKQQAALSELTARCDALYDRIARELAEKL
ncbi:MAG: cyclodeaminase/cyclohydrolase family protein [Clostridia bacterium]|nr:cyclodeaminase/cyclohydrolase family protein [Clostridia bacterium]